jgi:3',5'-cyclic AMP phosphodiesterase CpdA
VTAGPVLAALDRPRTAPRVRLAIVADPHVAVDGHGSWKVAHRSPERFRTALADATARGVDAVLLPGDLTSDGRPREFTVVDDLLSALTVPWAAVPGNHDVPKAFDSHEGLSVERFAERLAPGLPFEMSVGPLTVLGVNSASATDGELADSWGGRLSEAQLEWVAERVDDAETPIVCTHHNLGPLPENPGGKWANFPLQNAAAVRKRLADLDVPLVVTGHHHVPAVQRHGETTELLAPATCSYPQASLLLDVGPEGTTVRLVPLADSEGLREARRHARTGKALGQGVLEMAERRLARLPLTERPEL